MHFYYLTDTLYMYVCIYIVWNKLLLLLLLLIIPIKNQM